MSLKREVETPNGSSTEDAAQNQFSFELSDCTDTDVTFFVDGKELRFYKILLSLSSPVFDRMLNEQKTTSVIELSHGYGHDDMVMLFEQMHPALAIRPVTDDNLMPLMKLAERYRVRHVVTKCRQYIADQTRLMELKESRSEDSTFDESSGKPDQTAVKAWLYLTMLLEYRNLSYVCRKQLVKLAANRSMDRVERLKSVVAAPEELVMEVYFTRCSMLEGLMRRKPAVQQQRGLHNDARVRKPIDQSPGDDDVTMTEVS